MEHTLRDTGIKIIGNAPWATHFCQFYQTKEDLLDILVPYFKAGLENNEFCMWITSEPLSADEARRALDNALPAFSSYLKKGQIEILPHTDWYLKDGYFDSKRVLQGWVNRLHSGLKSKFAGLRLTGNTFWLEKKDWKTFSDYEAEINSVIGKYKILALCTYSLDKCNSLEVIDVIRNHEFALIKQAGTWEIIENSAYRITKQALLESEKNLRQLYSSMNEGVALHEIIYDKTGRPVDYLITDINPAFESITGIQKESVIGKKASKLYGADKAPYLDIYAQVASGQGNTAFETYFPPMNKHFSISVFSPERGKFATVFTDISERKKVEDRINALNQSLTQRTKQLEAANKELEAFSYSVSHDLRAPLRAMNGFAQALTEDYRDKLDGPALEYLQRIRNASRLMSELIDGLLSLSRANISELHFDKVNLSELAQQIAANLRNSEPHRQVVFIISPDMEVSGDTILLRQALDNLLSNAFKFTEKVSQARIEFGVTKIDDKNAYFVKDNGAGFDMTYVDKLFKPFQRLHPSTEFSGSGIGLALVNRIITRHGGKIWAEGEPGKGATIFFTL
jgi:signal transduction histidine kinase